MNYEEKYKEALERAKKEWSNNLDGAYKNYRERLEIIFPELKDSEDGKIVKAILKGLIDCRDAPDLGWTNFGGIKIDDCIAWLEKQTSKTKWSEEDDYNVQCCIAKAERDIANGYHGRNKELIEWLKSLKDRVQLQSHPTEWNEDDERIRKGLIEIFKWFCGDFYETTKWGKDDDMLVRDIITWLEKQGKGVGK